MSNILSELVEMNHLASSENKYSSEQLPSSNTVKSVLKNAEAADEVETVTFGLETDDNNIVKVYVNVNDADNFEKALSDMLGSEDNIEFLLDELSKEYDIVSVDWPEDDDDDDEDDDDEVDNDEDDDDEVEDDEVDNDEDGDVNMKESFGQRFKNRILEVDDLDSSTNDMDPAQTKLDKKAHDNNSRLALEILSSLGIPPESVSLILRRTPTLLKSMKQIMLDLGPAGRKRIMSGFGITADNLKESALPDYDDMDVDIADSELSKIRSNDNSMSTDEWEVSNTNRGLTLKSNKIEIELDFNEMLDLIDAIGKTKPIRFKDDDNISSYSFAPRNGGYIIRTPANKAGYTLSKDTVDKILDI